MLLRFLAVAVLLLCTGAPARAWGPDGHKIICAIAWDEMNQTIQDRVKRMLDVKGREDFANACNWADEYARAGGHSETLPWHFVNTPLGAATIDIARDCGEPTSCVVAQIETQAAQVRSAATDDARAMALKFMMHFIGDEHQPLHVTPATGDKGGNAIHGTFKGREANFHQVWDSGFIFADGRPWPEIADALRSKITDQQRVDWEASTPLDWANESLALSTSPRIGYLGMKDGFDISDAYIAQQTPLVFERLSRAGVRLAYYVSAAVQTAYAQDKGGNFARLAEAQRLFEIGQRNYAINAPLTEEVFKQALAIRLEELPPTDEVLADSYHLLAGIELNLQNFPDAERHFRDALRIYDATPHVDRLKIISVLNGLTSALGNLKKSEEGEHVALRSIAEQQALGPSYKMSGRAQRALGLLYRDQGKYRQAIKAFEDFKKIQQAQVPVDKDKLANAEFLLNETKEVRRKENNAIVKKWAAGIALIVLAVAL